MSAWGEIDHVMFFCDQQAPEAEALVERGFFEGPRNSHPGQGTTNRRFFLRNAFLELLWVENFAEAQSPEVLRTGLWNRWSRRKDGVCPIGLVLRPGSGPAPRPIDSWVYRPNYFPEGFSVEIAKDIPDHEPLLIHLPFAQSAQAQSLTPSGVPVGAVIGATVHVKSETLSPALNALVEAGVVKVEASAEYSVDLHHDGGSSAIIDVRPALPLRFMPNATRARPSC